MPELPHKPLTVLPGPTPEESEEISSVNRRSDVRFPFTAAAEILHIRSQTRIAGRVSDLGSRGCYIDTLCPFEEGAVVRVRLVHLSEEFEALAVVAYASAPMGMGLTFTDIGPEHQEVLNNWMAQLSGTESPAPQSLSPASESAKLATVENVRHALRDLINLMVRKRIISENEGAGLLRQISR